MRVNNYEMYHFHNNMVFNELWVEDNEIIVDDSFNSAYITNINNYSTTVNTSNNGKQSFDKIINYYLNEVQMNEKLYIQFLKDAEYIIKFANVFKRELALEIIRKEKYPNLPSRSHSIWLCDKEGLDFWKKELSTEKIKLDLYKVLLNGNLFKSSDAFLPSSNSNYNSNLIEADNYWNPKFENEEQKKKQNIYFKVN